MIAVICGTELDEHHVHCGEGCGDEDAFHGRIVERDEVCEKIQVPCSVDQRKHNLCLPRQT